MAKPRVDLLINGQVYVIFALVVGAARGYVLPTSKLLLGLNSRFVCGVVYVNKRKIAYDDDDR